ncbi:hypothetical protein SEPCBS57363_002355 [Sporothrix epigloea]|uniref:V-type c subunit family protein n=1 Tax=Sporothrix epigloea TaxID=1892477 RepID=A0ABP0DFE4_9PEZI
MTIFALRPRLTAVIAATRFAPQCIRCLSYTARRASGQFTVAASPSSAKKTVLDTIQSKRHVLIAQNKAVPLAQPDNAVVVLATPEFAAWLDDAAFLAALLQQLPLSHPQSNADTSTSVLCAVVAAIAAPQTASKSGRVPVSGLSIAYGNTEALLPGLWHSDGSREVLRSSRGSIGSDLDNDAAITIETQPLAGSSLRSSGGSLRVTLPLSNTIFQNGRRSTLLASLWEHSGPEGTFERHHVESREHQLVVVPPTSGIRATAEGCTSQVSVPLFALSEPLKIASGLGNIVRQVLDTKSSKPIPAARGLESDIPALLAARRKASPGLEDGALAVWGLVVPEKAIPFYEQLRLRLQSQGDMSLHALAIDADHAPAAEQQVAHQTSAHFTALLSAGCRLHRILSGGGGWGLKQGLLSLDPQMSHPTAASFSHSQSSNAATQPKILGEECRDEELDDEAMLSFIRSFKNETLVGREMAASEVSDGSANGEASVDGVAMPGALVQFFVAPLLGITQAAKAEARLPETNAETGVELSAWSIALGGDGSGASGMPSGADTEQVALIHNHFGAVSSQGIFLAAAADGKSDGSADSPVTRTKLDAPSAYLWANVHLR